jgi:hypothetical protein
MLNLLHCGDFYQRSSLVLVHGKPAERPGILVTIEIACVPWYQSRILRQFNVQVCSKQLIAGNTIVLREKPGRREAIVYAQPHT